MHQQLLLVSETLALIALTMKVTAFWYMTLCSIEYITTKYYRILLSTPSD